jgi:acyl-CoA synthetase (NDP forming)
MKKHPLDFFLNPVSVAVVGASRKTGKGSFNLIERMVEFGFKGRIYPINPSAGDIMGLKAYKRIGDIEDRVDLAVISVPREQVPAIVEECARRGNMGAIIVPQGFADADETGKDLQDQLTQIARQTGIRILGPNTLGVINAFSGLSTSFVPHKREKVPVGVICQSGMFFVGSAVFTGTMGKGIDIGNGCDLDFADALEYFGDDDDIDVIFIHIEGMRQGRRFFEIARRVSRRKPIIALKAARSKEGAKAALSHSGTLVGQPEIFEAMFQQAGITIAMDSQEVHDFTRAFLRLSPMAGNRIGVVTFTGAGGILLIDTLEQNGLRLAKLSPDTIESVQALSPAWMSIGNPLDIWPALMKHGMDKVYRIALKGLLMDHAVDGIIWLRPN